MKGVRMSFGKKILLSIGGTLSVVSALAGTSCRDGIAKALPLPQGKAPVVDGSLADWDTSAPVLVWNAEQYADRQNCTLYFMYDAEYLYIAAEMALYDHAPHNDNRTEDRYWLGDVIQIRLSTDKSLGHPLPNRGRPTDRNSKYVKNDRVTCVNIWKNTAVNEDNLFITPGAFFDGRNVNRPQGSAVKIVAGEKSLTFETRTPWSALGVPDGGCPFSPGEKMPLVADIKWFPGSDGHFAAAIFCKDPGAFAFMNLQTWGQLEFSTKGNLVPSGETYATIAAAAKKRDAIDTTGWSEIRFNLPKRAKVSVNIFDAQGGVIRELTGGEERAAGEVRVAWDGRDALGFPCETGKAYRWGAYAHDGVDVTYFGTVGTSGEPPYDTLDRKGGWGGDHGPVVDAACDDSGRYFVWHKSESGKGIVKTGFDGKVLWRTMPFVVDGWGNYTCLASDGAYLYLVYERRSANPAFKLVRVDTKTGNYIKWPSGEGATDIDLPKTPIALPPHCAVRECYKFDCVGAAVLDGEVFLSECAGDRLLVHDAATGLFKREIKGVKAPRGLWLHERKLYVASLVGAILRVDPKSGAVETLADRDLVAPHGIAVDAAGLIHVSDLGASQQVKTFANGRLVRTLGKAGGRGCFGKIDAGAFELPFGLAVDKTGALLVTEAASPKIVRVLDAATGRELRRYYGYTAYSPSNIPDPDDPLLQYYSLEGPDSFARARIPETGGAGMPDAVWDFAAAGLGEFGTVMNTMTMPEILRATNGRKYLVPDGTPDHRDPTLPMTICLVDGDTMRPVAGCYRVPNADKRVRTATCELWTDANGNGRKEPDECARFSQVAGRTFGLASCGGAFYMADNGDAFLLTQENFVIGIPSRGFTAAGVPRWNVAAAYVAIPEILPGMKRLFCGWRCGLVGLRRDRAGNFYAAVTGSPKYASDAYAKYMHQGMGHTADVLGVFMTKYDPQGKLVWRTGRKAVGGMRPGEILHHWCFAGLIGDEYAVAASEWGVFTIYTKDGFYVDHLFDVPGFPGRGIPYSFGGEDFSGRIRYFPKRDEVWAFNAGHTFRVSGFEKGRVKGEWRTSGTVRLGKVQPLVFPGAKPKAISDVRFKRPGDRLVFTAHVADATPLVNVAAQANQIFKGGDAVGFELGPATAPKELPERKPTKECFGYTRLLAARMNGRDVVVAFKPFTKGIRMPQEYATPAGGTSAFAFCGEVPDAKVAFKLDDDGKGYTATIDVPFAFLELPQGKRIYYDAEVLLSGEGGRGLQTLKKEYLHNPDSSSVLMTDDVPTEARLHPAGWKELTECSEKPNL